MAKVFLPAVQISLEDYFTAANLDSSRERALELAMSTAKEVLNKAFEGAAVREIDRPGSTRLKVFLPKDGGCLCWSSDGLRVLGIPVNRFNEVMAKYTAAIAQFEQMIDGKALEELTED